MAVTLSDQRTIINEADATTSWTGSATVTLFTTEPTGIESTGCLGMVVSNATQNAYFTLGASVNFTSGYLIYAWIFHRAELDTRANGGLMIQLGDGTNRIGFHVGGSDVDGFRHSEGPVGWQCLVLDTAQLPTAQTVFAGSFANLNLAAITQIGIGFKTLVKAVGGVSNCFWDIMRYGSVGQGLVVTGGSSGDPGTWEQIAAADRGTGNQQAYGIVRKLGTGVYGVQGPITFGDGTGTTSSYFADTNATVVFEERGLYSDKYSITVTGNGTGDTTFILGTKVGTGSDMTGINGCVIQAPSTTPAQFIATDVDIDEMSLYGCQLVGFSEGVTLSNDATTGPNHEIAGTTFRNCGQVDAGRTFIRNCVFTGTTHFKQSLNAAIQDDGGVFTSFTTAANNDTADDVNITPAAPANNDAFYIGHVAKFNEIRVLVSSAGTGTYAVEFWNGSTWTAVSGLVDTTSGFSKIRRGKITYTMPGTWATTTVNSQGPYYYIRFRVTSAGTQARATRFKLFGPADGSALLWNSNIDIQNCEFNNNTDATNDPHGIEHPANGTFDYTGMSFSGNDYDIEYSENGGSSNVTINASDSNPTTFEVTGTTSGTVIINNTVAVTLTGLVNPTEVRVYATGTRNELDGEESVTTGTFTFSLNAGTDVDIRIFSLGYEPADIFAFEVPAAAVSVPVQQKIDRTYSNP